MGRMRSVGGAVSAAAVAAGPAAAQQTERGWMHDDMMGWGGGFVWSMLTLLLLGLAVAAVVVVLVRLFGPGRSGQTRDRALDVLRERYARGEIGREEYEERRRSLER